jgi:ATP-binding cassette subfamily F protein uup
VMQRPRPAPASTRKAARTEAPPRPEPARKRLTFNEQRELAALPDELEALEREQHALTARMCAPDYHRHDVAQIKADRARAEEIEHLLATRFARWGELDARTDSR